MIQIDKDKEALSMSRFMRTQYSHIPENVVITLMPKFLIKKQDDDNRFVTCIKIIVSAFFSFGVFRDAIKEQSYKDRYKILVNTIVSWLLVAIILSVILFLYSGSICYAFLTFAASCLITYGAFQMLSIEYKRLSFFLFVKDSTGLWEESRIEDIVVIRRKWYLDFLLPIRIMLRHLKFLNSLYNCSREVESSNLDVYKYIDSNIKSAENIYAIFNGKLYKVISCTKHDINDITVHKASPKDIKTVAWTVLTALDMDTHDLEWVKESCADELSMYSWNKSIVAVVDGKPVGAIISYPGDDYNALRQYTWKRLWNDIDSDTIIKTEVEAHPGEYYLDSMAIQPEYRGLSIGKSLIEAAIDQGKSLGYKKFTLLVDCNKPRLKAYYESLGFQKNGEMTFLGHRYKRMMKNED